MVNYNFQSGVKSWMFACFGAMTSADKKERTHRFLEEALELVQACECTEAEAHTLVSYVFNRPVGEPKQEVGGVMITLAALCEAQDIDMKEEGYAELRSVWGKIEEIRQKHKTKPFNSPTP